MDEKKESFKEEEPVPFTGTGEIGKILGICHDLLRSNEGYDPEEAFHEIVKILFTKIYDERSGKRIFRRKPNENEDKCGERIKQLFKEAIEHYEVGNGIFPEKEELRTSNATVTKLVMILQKYHLSGTDLDVKGSAFETFLGKTFRGQLGQYFTPRNVVGPAVRMLSVDEDDIILDPACGTGGFLIYCVRQLREKWESDLSSKQVQEKISWFVNNSIYGFDIAPKIIQVAKLNMLVNEGARGNLYNWNAYWSFEKYKKPVKKGNFTRVFTNPQFGGNVTNDDHLRGFELAEGKKSQKSEVLKLERCIQFLDGNREGLLCIVLPDGLLSNKSLNYVRDYIREKTILEAVVSLPQETFQPYGSDAKTSLLFLRKKRDQEEKQGLVFMASVGNIGYDNTGRDTGENYLERVPPLFWRFLREGKPIEKIDEGLSVFTVAPNELIDRLDVKFYNPQFLEKLHKTRIVQESDAKIVELDEVVDACTGYTPPRGEYLEEPGIPIIKVGDLTNEGINWGRHKRLRGYVPRSVYNNHPEAHTQKRDILLTAAGHAPKYVAKKVDIVDYIPNGKSRCMISAELMKLRLKDRRRHYINPYFLLAYLRSDYAYQNFQRCIRGQTGHIYTEDVLKAVHIPLLKQDYQDKIAKKIRDGLKYRRKMRKLTDQVSSEISEVTRLEEDIK